MDDATRQRYENRAQVVKALAHPTRLFLVDRLSRGQQCVADLTAMIGADMSTVSKHLAVLKGVGIVGDRRRGVQVFYYLKTPCVLSFFGCIESVLRESAEPAPILIDIEDNS